MYANPFLFVHTRFTTAYTQSDFPVQVKLRQNLYFQATVISQDKRLSVLAENCYATPSQDRQRADKYVLLKDGLVWIWPHVSSFISYLGEMI